MTLFDTGAYSAQQQGGIYSTLRPERNPIANAILGVVFFAVAIAAYPAKLFFREHLGERAIRIIDPFIYLIAFCQLGFWTALGSFLLHSVLLGDGLLKDWSWLGIALSLPIPSLVFLFWLFRISYKHFKSINLHQSIEYDNRCHSFYRGDSRYFKSFIGKNWRNATVSQFHIQLLAEPLSTFLFGIALLFLDMTLGIALMIGGVCFFIDEFEVIRRRRDMVLDVLDGEMDAMYIEKARNLFRKLKEEDVDLAKIDIGFDLHRLLNNGSKNNRITILPPLSQTNADTDII
ncbi:MAG: hypothetical protein JNL70_11745 [Saprospiraceae bacterium]|nr:hypothetical protein [Saprospiraceae bacterium]